MIDVPMKKIFVLGIGYSPLGPRALEALKNSSVILTSKRLVEVFLRYKEAPQYESRIKVIEGVDATMEFVHSFLKGGEGGSITILASGDPMFYGIGRRTIQEFGKGMVEVIPELSSIQVAFARAKEAWDDAHLISLHGGPYPGRRTNKYQVGDIPDLVSRHKKLCILTDPVNNPKRIAEGLVDAFGPNGGPEMVVCERLGYESERVVMGSPYSLQDQDFQDPNLVILLDKGSQRPLFGLKEKEIGHTKGMITKDEVRAVVLHKLRLPPKGVVWDIGAGSGAISLEVSLISQYLDVFSV